MELRAWSLALFTVLVQACVGALFLTLWLDQRTREATARGTYRRLERALVLIALLALTMSLAYSRALTGAPSSVQSPSDGLIPRIALAGVFTLLLALTARAEEKPVVRRVVSWLAALAGVVVVGSIAMLYQPPSLTSARALGTLVGFGGATLFLGAALAAALQTALSPRYQEPIEDLRDLAWVGVAAACIELISLALQAAGVAVGDPTARAMAGLPAGSDAPVLVLRWAMTLLGGVVLLLLALWRLAEGKVPANLLYMAGIAILAGELLGRYHVYATAARVGMR